MDKREVRFWSLIDTKQGRCWAWTGAKTKGGYGVVCYLGERTTAHRIAFRLNRGAIPEGHVVMHLCDNPACCNPDHLCCGTQKENLHDMDRKGRRRTVARSGIEHGMAKLTQEQCQEIRRLYKETPLSQEKIGDMFGIVQSHVSRIILGYNRADS